MGITDPPDRCFDVEGGEVFVDEFLSRLRTDETWINAFEHHLLDIII